jgi:hypothetical protein
MSLQEIYFVAEITAAVAVVASLIFVGVQQRQSTSATQSSNAQAALTGWSEMGLTLANSPDLLNALERGSRLELPSALEDDNAIVQVQYYLAASLKFMEGNFLQWLDGNLSDNLWHGFHQTLINMFATNTSWAGHWSFMSNTYSVPFQQLIVEVIDAAEIRFSELKQSA